MSVVLLSGKHYDSVAKHLVKFIHSTDNGWIKYRIAEWYQVDANQIDINETLVSMVQDWQRLNTETYNNKYNESYPIESLKNGIDLNDYQVVSALKSIEYQIEDDHLDDPDSYNNKESLDMLERMIGLVCRVIVTNLPAYANPTNTHFIE